MLNKLYVVFFQLFVDEVEYVVGAGGEALLGGEGVVACYLSS